jgi:hypothetical protein
MALVVVPALLPRDLLPPPSQGKDEGLFALLLCWTVVGCGGCIVLGALPSLPTMLRLTALQGIDVAAANRDLGGCEVSPGFCYLAFDRVTRSLGLCDRPVMSW